jgi:hypothetical protein
MLDPVECGQARVSRNRAHDGRFFAGVRTTGVYCRPVCPVRLARGCNVEFFPSAAAAEVAGYRPPEYLSASAISGSGHQCQFAPRAGDLRSSPSNGHMPHCLICRGWASRADFSLPEEEAITTAISEACQPVDALSSVGRIPPRPPPRARPTCRSRSEGIAHHGIEKCASAHAGRCFKRENGRFWRVQFCTEMARPERFERPTLRFVV